MCTCIDLTNAALVERNQELKLMLSLSGQPPKLYVETMLIQKRRGQRPMKLIATYCPFCGERYPEEGV